MKRPTYPEELDLEVLSKLLYLLPIITEIPGMRPDFVDFGTNTIFELKPFNKNGFKTGTKQLEKYKVAFEKHYPGSTWNTLLQHY